MPSARRSEVPVGRRNGKAGGDAGRSFERLHAASVTAA
jgi:hypothetical protein